MDTWKGFTSITPPCAFCGAPSRGACSKCHREGYCRTEHEAAHRPLHEPFCAPEWTAALSPVLATAAACPRDLPPADVGTEQVSIVMTQTKGKTLVANRAFHAQEACLSETPLLRIVSERSQRDHAHRYRGVIRAYLGAPMATQRAILQLFHPDPGSDGARRLPDVTGMERVAAELASTMDVARIATRDGGGDGEGRNSDDIFSDFGSEGSGGGNTETFAQYSKCNWDRDSEGGRGNNGGWCTADANDSHRDKKCEGKEKVDATFANSDLHGRDKEDGASTLLRVLFIYALNGFSGGKDEETHGSVDEQHEVTYLFDVASRFSHSCDPNCCRFIRAGDGRITVRALRDLPAGEELTISYINPEDLALSSQRRNAQLEPFVFLCDCRRCAGFDDVRGFLCPACKEGDVFLLGIKGELDAEMSAMSPCSACGQVPREHAAAQMEDDEAELCQELEELDAAYKEGRMTSVAPMMMLLRRCQLAGMRKHALVYQLHDLVSDKCACLGLFGLAVCHTLVCIRHIMRVCRGQPVPLAFRVEKLAQFCAGCIHPWVHLGRQCQMPPWEDEDVVLLTGQASLSGDAAFRMPFVSCPNVGDVVRLFQYTKSLLAQVFMSIDSTYVVEASASLDNFKQRVNV